MTNSEIHEGLLSRILGLGKGSAGKKAAEIDQALDRARREAGDITPTTSPLTPTGKSSEELLSSPEAQAATQKRQAAQTAAIQNIRRGEPPEPVPNVFRPTRSDPRFTKPHYAKRPGETVEQAIRRIQAEKKAAEQLPDAFKDIQTPSGSSIKQGIDSSRVSGRTEPGGDLSTINIPRTGKPEPTFDPDIIGQPVELPAAAKPGVMNRIGQWLKPDISPLEASLYLHGGIGTGAYIANKTSNREEPAEPKPAEPTSVSNKPVEKPADDDFDKEMQKLRETLRKVRYNG